MSPAVEVGIPVGRSPELSLSSEVIERSETLRGAADPNGCSGMHCGEHVQTSVRLVAFATLHAIRRSYNLQKLLALYMSSLCHPVVQRKTP